MLRRLLNPMLQPTREAFEITPPSSRKQPFSNTIHKSSLKRRQALRQVSPQQRRGLGVGWIVERRRRGKLLIHRSWMVPGWQGAVTSILPSRGEGPSFRLEETECFFS